MDKNILLVHQIPSKIIDIIETSREYCFLITPYFQTWNLLDREFEKAAKSNKKIIFIFRDENNARERFSYLNEMYDFDLIFVERLHTKLYMNEKEVLISSMNLYDSSKENNFEIGYNFFTTSTSRSFKKQVIEDDILKNSPFIIKGRYFKDIDEKEEKKRLREETLEKERLERKEKRELEKQQKISSLNSETTGYCIRCHTLIPYNKDKPMCDSCFHTWSFWQNRDFGEKYCHSCGTNFFDNITFARPLCYDCYS